MYSNEDPGGVTFFEFITNDYHKIKTKTFKGICFNEDVFHDTIIKLHKHFDNSHYSPEFFEKYTHSALRMNMIREKLFFRNSMTKYVNTFEELDFRQSNDCIEKDIDFCLIMESISKRFGENYSMLYMDWLAGYDIKESMEKHNIKSGYHYIKKINEFVKKELFEI
jgi:deoxyadenosine/deoxycytidine kinase